MNRAGDIAELSFMLEAVKNNLDVFNPFSHSTKVDCIVMKAGGLPIRVQVKKGVRIKRCKRATYKVVVGSCKSSTFKRGDKPRIARYSENDFDILAIDLGEHGFSFWKLEDICHQTTWRWNPTRPTNNWNIFKSLT